MQTPSRSAGAGRPPERGAAAAGPRRIALCLWSVLVPALALLPAAHGAPPAVADWRIEPFEWHGRLAAGGVLTVRNPYGDVRARRAEEGAAVYAAMQRHREDPREWTISIAEEGAGLVVEVVPGAGTAPAAAAADWGYRRVDLTVYVPAGARLEVETAAGLIEAKRLRSDVRARSAAGEIVITTAGSVDARSQAGRIRYSFLDPAWVGSARLVTRAGDVVVTLPRGANIDLAIRTRGEISTDGPPAPAGAEEEGRRLQATVGAGGSPITIESESGNVKVQRIPS